MRVQRGWSQALFSGVWGQDQRENWKFPHCSIVGLDIEKDGTGLGGTGCGGVRQGVKGSERRAEIEATKIIKNGQNPLLTCFFTGILGMLHLSSFSGYLY